MIQLQLLTGARPGEIVQLRACDLDTSDDIWVTRPELHKLAYRGIERAIFFGVKAQALLREFMSTKGVHEYLFSPADAAREQHEDSPTHRRPGQKETSRTTKRRLGERYTTKSYRQAIVRACEKVKDTDAGKSIKLVTWTPNQLRHNAATAIRREFGLEAARQVLGHTKADTTQIYAERDARVVKQVMSEIG
jgi:integrase